VISGQLRRRSGRIIRELYQQQSVERVEGHAMPAHVPLCLSSPPTFSVANTVGWLTGKSAIHFREGCEAGAHQGTQIARFVVRHELRPLKGK
jgi:REP element-mobilizing transposase RayT